jgi:hypothetical protein
VPAPAACRRPNACCKGAVARGASHQPALPPVWCALTVPAACRRRQLLRIMGSSHSAGTTRLPQATPGQVLACCGQAQRSMPALTGALCWSQLQASRLRQAGRARCLRWALSRGSAAAQPCRMHAHPLSSSSAPWHALCCFSASWPGALGRWPSATRLPRAPATWQSRCRPHQQGTSQGWCLAPAGHHGRKHTPPCLPYMHTDVCAHFMKARHRIDAPPTASGPSEWVVMLAEEPSIYSSWPCLGSGGPQTAEGPYQRRGKFQFSGLATLTHT